MSVTDVLKQAGMPHLIKAFESLSLDRFKGLLIQDYDKHGVSEFGDKQALFRLIQELNAEDLQLNLSPAPNSAPISAVGSRLDLVDSNYTSGQEEGFLDLEGDDDDEFLGEDFDADAFSREFIRNTTMRTPPQGNKPTTRSGSNPTMQQFAANNGQLFNNAADAAVANHMSTSLSNTAEDITPLPLHEIVDPPKIRVIVRKRPLNKKELERGDTDVLECEGNNTLFVNEPKVKVDLTKYTERHNFRFDDVFDENINNDDLYLQAIQPLIATILRGGKATCFAYGQTGSGKTFTMGPLPVRAAADIFSVMQRLPVYQEVDLAVSCFEIYGGKIYDLLNKRNRLEVREDGKKRVQVVGLSEQIVESVPVLNQVCDKSAGSRSTGSTGANDESSRSHSIMTFTLRCRGEKPATIGKLSFIDLAGSERGADTYDNDKQTRMEGAEINKSLLALKECIRALDSSARHIPFRGSKLTSVLRDSFIGRNTRTVMIGCVSPNSTSCEHTLNTLRYADRVKEIRKDTGRGTGPSANSVSDLGLSPEEALTAGQVAALLKNMRPANKAAAVNGSEQANGHTAAAAAAAAATQAAAAQAYALEQQELQKQMQQQELQKQMQLQEMQRMQEQEMQRLQQQQELQRLQQQQELQRMQEMELQRMQQQEMQRMMQQQQQQLQQQQQIAAMQAAAAQHQQQTQSLTRGGSSGAGKPPSPPRTNSLPSPTRQNSLPSPGRQSSLPKSNGSVGVRTRSPSPATTSPTNNTSPTKSPGGAGKLPRRLSNGALTGNPLVHAISISDTASGNTVDDDTHATASTRLANGHGGGGNNNSVAHNEALNALLSSEEELISAHRAHIEESMSVVREEMELLAKLDGSDNGADVERYVEDLSNLLMDKQAAIALLQQQVAKFRRKMRAAMDAASQ